jgi:hypothetical protein
MINCNKKFKHQTSLSEPKIRGNQKFILHPSKLVIFLVKFFNVKIPNKLRVSFKIEKSLD